mmetsp:Transcript_69318/g.149543  ORF Transcript_69318/g.149543 Transcript_69318/m.149543 type:complete len:105 (-) Transcript_69318:626-940(-)
MKEENKKEIELINVNFKKIEESALSNSDRDINALMRNYKNLINLAVTKHAGPEEADKDKEPSKDTDALSKAKGDTDLKDKDKKNEEELSSVDPYIQHSKVFNMD